MGTETYTMKAGDPKRSSTDMSAKYEARHLLIKFSGSRNPVSRRTGESTANVSGEAAMAELQTYIDKIAAEGNTEEAFVKYAEMRSDCSSFKNGGDLGPFGPGEMQKQCAAQLPRAWHTSQHRPCPTLCRSHHTCPGSLRRGLALPCLPLAS